MGFTTSTDDAQLAQRMRLSPAIQRVVEQTLGQVKLVLQSAEKISTKYKFVHLSKEGSNDTALSSFNASTLLPDSFWKFHVRHTQEQCLAQNSDRPKLSSFKKIKWAVVDKDKFAGLVEDLKFINDSLQYLSGREQRTLDVGLPSRILPKVSDPNALSSLAKASEGTYETLSQCAKFKSEMTATSTISLLVDRRQVTFDPDEINSTRPLATFSTPNSSYRVIIEWKSYAKNRSLNMDQDISQRIADLVYLLSRDSKPSDFRSLDCLGYFQDRLRSRYGFLYQIPEFADPLKPSVSLFSLIPDSVMQPTSAASNRKPTLGQRFFLAQSLTASFLQLHASGWIHKSPTSNNIIFFNDSKSQKLDLRNPFIAGFEYARPRGSAQISEKPLSRTDEDLYRHPNYDISPLTGEDMELDNVAPVSNRYQSRYDIYSIGLILFEIGIWQRINSFWTPGIDKTRFRAALLENLWRLDSEVGDIYRGAVEKCLTGEFGLGKGVLGIDDDSMDEKMDVDDEDDEASAEKLRKSYLWKVVNELSKCRA